MEINGGDDDNEEIIDIPSGHRDARVASLILQRYVADLDDPCVRKLEAVLRPSSMPAGVARNETNSNHILFYLCIDL
ncbi:hypothetical protein BYT27DRAFT_6640623 [Phlegmacium glaucopus]|nr:hypothetical protein BYT27DRAFT_6640623 [Phlegmacium glaucopus]